MAFENMLGESMAEADLVAHVEIISFRHEKKAGDSSLYEIKAKILKSFKGPSLASVVFYQWTEENIESNDAIGERVIVALQKSEEDEKYFIPKGSSAFPAHKNLLDLAGKSLEKKSK